MNNLKPIIIIHLLALFSLTGFAQSKTFTNWTENKDGFRKLCFYPTTLRMVNLTKDESFNEMIQDIDKLRIFISDNPEKPVKKEEISTLRKGIKSEDYKDMIQVNQGKQVIYVFVKENHEKPTGFAGIVYSENSFMLIDVEGYLSPEVITRLINGKVNFGAVSKLYDITKLGQDKKNKPDQKK